MKLSASISAALAFSASCAGAFVTPHARSPAFKNCVLKATPADAIQSFQNAQIATVNKIASLIPDLESKADLSWAPGVYTIASSPVSLDGRDAPGSANIAWLGSVTVDAKLSSLTIFNGPLTDVPHLLSRCLVNPDNTISLALDFRPRAYGAYEMMDAQGNYPGPETLGRDAFTFSGNRKDYEDKFGTDEVVAFMQATAASFEGGVIDNIYNEFEELTKGPLSLKVNMPLTDGNVAAVVAAREKAAEFWLTWALEDSHAHRPGAPINSQYVYDTKYRQNAYSALMPVYSAAFGADGSTLAAAESGPLDEGYVGGGS